MPQQAIGRFGKAALRPDKQADRVEPHFADAPPFPDADANVEAEIQRFTESGELRVADAPARRVDAAEPLVQDRKLWLAEQHQRLTEAEAAWEARNRNRTAAARMTVQRAEASMEQLRRQLLQMQETLAAKDGEIAKAWAACEQERARRTASPAATQQQKAERAQKFERRMTTALRVGREFAWTALVVGLAILAAQRAAPVAVGMWQQETGPHSHLKPLLAKAGLPLVLPEKPPGWTVAVPIANLRTRPASGAPVLMVLPLSTAVTPTATYGKWTFVRTGDGTTEQQGWVATASLAVPKK